MTPHITDGWQFASGTLLYLMGVVISAYGNRDRSGALGFVSCIVMLIGALILGRAMP